MNKEFGKLKGKLDEKEKQIEQWHPKVHLAINKLDHLLLMCDEHKKVCKSFNGVRIMTSMENLWRRMVRLRLLWLYFLIDTTTKKQHTSHSLIYVYPIPSRKT